MLLIGENNVFFIVALTLTFFNIVAEQDKQFNWKTHYLQLRKVCFMSKQS